MGGASSRNSGGRGHHGGYGGSGDAGFQDRRPERHQRNSGGSHGHGGRGSGSGRSMPQMDVMDNPSPMGPGAFGTFNEFSPGHSMSGGAPHGFQSYGGPQSFRQGGPEFAMDGGDDTRTMKVSIKNEDAGAVIGPKGATINRVRERSGCNIKIDDGRSPESIRGMRIITITGTDQQIQFAQYLMQQRLVQDGQSFLMGNIAFWQSPKFGCIKF